jgi:hypothetical protein
MKQNTMQENPRAARSVAVRESNKGRPPFGS